MFGWYDENVEKWIFFFFFCWEEKWKGKKNNSYKFTSIPLFDKKINNKLKKKKKAWNLNMCGGKKGYMNNLSSKPLTTP